MSKCARGQYLDPHTPHPNRLQQLDLCNLHGLHSPINTIVVRKACLYWFIPHSQCRARGRMDRIIISMLVREGIGGRRRKRRRGMWRKMRRMRRAKKMAHYRFVALILSQPSDPIAAAD